MARLRPALQSLWASALLLASTHAERRTILQRSDNHRRGLERFRGQMTIDEGGDLTGSAALPLFDLLIVMPTDPENDNDRRHAIRNTWGQYIDKTGKCSRCSSRRTIKYIFTCAEKGGNASFEDEVSKHNDIARLSGMDAEQYPLRGKTGFSIRHAMEHFRFNLLLKADTDSWVFLDRLLDFAEQHKLFDHPSPGVYAGLLIQGIPVSNPYGPAGKWLDLEYTKETGLNTYPRHAKGAGYLLTPDLCRFIAEFMGDSRRHPTLPKFKTLPSEDVTVGFWLQIVEHQWLSMPMSIQGTACSDDHGSSFVIDHYVTPESMWQRWSSLQETGGVCR